MKARKIEDSNTYLVKFPNHGTFQVDGKVVDVKGKEVQLKKIDDIREVTYSEVIVCYKNPEGEELSADDYQAQRKELESKGEYCEDYYEYLFDDLDDEYAYKKFKRDWVAQKKKETTIGDPMPIELDCSVVFDTGNKFITHEYAIGINEKDLVFFYNRCAAIRAIARETFESLGMKFEEGLGYAATNNKKVWSDDKTSRGCLRWTKAFGTYVFGDKYEGYRAQRGELEYLKNLYEQDKKEIETHLKSSYNVHFRSDISIDMELLLKDLSSLREGIRSIDSKQKTYRQYSSALNNAGKLIDRVKEEIAEQENG